MSPFRKRMKLKADCFDANVEIRDLARVAYAELLFDSFEGKDQAYITDRVKNDVLFLHASNTETMISQLNWLKGVLQEDDFEFFIEGLVQDAIVDQAYEKCLAIIEKFVHIKFKVRIDRLGNYDPDKIKFLEGVKDHIVIDSFFNFNFNTSKIGVEGYARLLKLTDKETLEYKIVNDDHRLHTYQYVLSAIQQGYLDDYFSGDICNVIIATSLSEFLDGHLDERYKFEAIADYSDSDLLEIFCGAMELSRNRDFLAKGLRTAHRIRSQNA